MDKNLRAVLETRVDRAIKALERNNMPARFVPDSKAAVRAVEDLLHEGDTVACGGSVSLLESGVKELMQSGRYHFIDREKDDPLEAFRADAFLMSSNAITENGELYNVDGFGNRVAALIYGPKQVIVVAGVNKLVRDLDEAVLRVKTVAAPANGMRIGARTPCALTGECSACNGGVTAGCSAEKRMCCHYVVTGFQRRERIRVILVGENLGY